MVSRERSSFDTVQSILNYAQEFEEELAVSFVDKFVLDIVNDVMFLNIRATNSKAAYARDIRIFKTMINSEGILPLIVSFAIGASVVTMLVITHLDDLGVYDSTEEIVRVIIQAANAFVKNDHMRAPFHASDFYNQTRALDDKLQDL